jgi:thiol-disulfide isomerase/thioredoxin
MIRRPVIAVACAIGLAVTLSGFAAAADGYARRKVRSAQRAAKSARGRQPQKAKAAAAKTSPIPTSPVSLIDEAGLKRLLARGTAPQDRPLLVNFWATWCDPCREEFPDLVRIDADYRPRGLDFVAISLDDLADIKTTVPKFLKEQRAAMPVFLLDVPDPGTIIQLVDPTWQGDLPATFLYDRSGNIAYKKRGLIKPDELRAEIDKLVGAGQ